MPQLYRFATPGSNTVQHRHTVRAPTPAGPTDARSPPPTRARRPATPWANCPAPGSPAQELSRYTAAMVDTSAVPSLTVPGLTPPPPCRTPRLHRLRTRHPRRTDLRPRRRAPVSLLRPRPVVHRSARCDTGGGLAVAVEAADSPAGAAYAVGTERHLSAPSTGLGVARGRTVHYPRDDGSARPELRVGHGQDADGRMRAAARCRFDGLMAPSRLGRKGDHESLVMPLYLTSAAGPIWLRCRSTSRWMQ